MGQQVRIAADGAGEMAVNRLAQAKMLVRIQAVNRPGHAPHHAQVYQFRALLPLYRLQERNQALAGREQNLLLTAQDGARHARQFVQCLAFRRRMYPVASVNLPLGHLLGNRHVRRQHQFLNHLGGNAGLHAVHSQEFERLPGAEHPDFRRLEGEELLVHGTPLAHSARQFGEFPQAFRQFDINPRYILLAGEHPLHLVEIQAVTAPYQGMYAARLLHFATGGVNGQKDGVRQPLDTFAKAAFVRGKDIGKHPDGHSRKITGEAPRHRLLIQLASVGNEACHVRDMDSDLNQVPLLDEGDAVVKILGIHGVDGEHVQIQAVMPFHSKWLLFRRLFLNGGRIGLRQAVFLAHGLQIRGDMA